MGVKDQGAGGMTNYERGARFERAIMADLSVDGFEVFRMAGSHSPVDVFAMKPGQLLLIQAKLNGKIAPLDRIELLRLATMINDAIPIIGWKLRGTRKPQYDALIGPGAKERIPWLADEVAAA
jgi:Holliday junction resolvase